MYCLVASDSVPTTELWLAVAANVMDEESNYRLCSRVTDPEDPLSAVGLLVLTNYMAQEALGIPLQGATYLGKIIIGSWFQFAAWCSKTGTNIETTPLHLLFPACYRWLVDKCKDQLDVDKLNRRIFGNLPK